MSDLSIREVHDIFMGEGAMKNKMGGLADLLYEGQMAGGNFTIDAHRVRAVSVGEGLFNPKRFREIIDHVMPGYAVEWHPTSDVFMFKKEGYEDTPIATEEYDGLSDEQVALLRSLDD